LNLQDIVQIEASLDRKVNQHKTRTATELIYEDELVKNMTTEICYEVPNTNPRRICIPINALFEGCNKHELCTYIDSGCSVCFRKRSLFLELCEKTQ